MEKEIIKRIETTHGFRLEDQDGNVVGYETDSTFNGHAYKDREAFLTGKGICYIGEYDSADLEEELTELKESLDKGEITEEKYREDRALILSGHGWTREKIVDLCGGEGFEKVAENVFDVVDWQEPSTYFDEFELEEEELPLYGLTKEQVLKAWGEDYFG